MTTKQAPTVVGQSVVFNKCKALTPAPDGKPHEYGTGKNGNLELLIVMSIPELGPGVTKTTPLYFSKDAAPYSFERLQVLGWKGQGPADLVNLTGIDTNEVDVVASCEEYEGKPNVKWQILTGGGRFHTQNPVSPQEFAAKARALLGDMGGSGSSPGAPPPPF